MTYHKKEKVKLIATLILLVIFVLFAKYDLFYKKSFAIFGGSQQNDSLSSLTIKKTKLLVNRNSCEIRIEAITHDNDRYEFEITCDGNTSYSYDCDDQNTIRTSIGGHENKNPDRGLFSMGGLVAADLHVKQVAINLTNELYRLELSNVQKEQFTYKIREAVNYEVTQEDSLSLPAEVLHNMKVKPKM